MDNSKVIKAQKTKKELAFFRVAAGSLIIILWVIFFLWSLGNSYSDFPSTVAYIGFIPTLFFADWISRKIYGLQVRAVYSIICETIPSFNPESDTCVLLLNNVVSELCCTSLLLDKCGNDPYRDTWNLLYNSVSKKLTRAAFSQVPDNLTSNGEELLKLFLGLGTYGVSYGYLSEGSLGKEIRYFADILDVFENARDILDVENLPSWSEWSNWEKRSWKRTRKILYKDIYAQLIISFHTLEAEFPSLAWDDIKSSPYPRFFDSPSEIKREFCADEYLTAEKYITDECIKWCDWHIENYPIAFIRAPHNEAEPYTLKSTLNDLKAVYAFLQQTQK